MFSHNEQYQMPRSIPTSNYHMQQHHLFQQQLQVFQHFQAFQRHNNQNAPGSLNSVESPNRARPIQTEANTCRPVAHSSPPNHESVRQQPHQALIRQQASGHFNTLVPGSTSAPELALSSPWTSTYIPDQVLYSPVTSTSSSPQSPSNSQGTVARVKPRAKSLDKALRIRNKPKRVRTIFTPEQLKRLECEFTNQMYLVGQDRCFLASSLNLSEAQVKVWFQNRRIKHRKLNPAMMVGTDSEEHHLISCEMEHEQDDDEQPMPRSSD